MPEMPLVIYAFNGYMSTKKEFLSRKSVQNNENHFKISNVLPEMPLVCA